MKFLKFEKVKDGKYLKNYEITYENKAGKEKKYEIDLHDTYTDRIFSRIASNYSICHLSGTDVRIQIKRNKNRK